MKLLKALGRRAAAVNKRKTLVNVALVGVMTAIAIEPAFAQAGGVNIEGVLQNIVDMLTGTVARLIAILALVLTGFAWMFMGLDIRKAGMIVAGIALVFGAPQIVSMMTGA